MAEKKELYCKRKGFYYIKNLKKQKLTIITKSFSFFLKFLFGLEGFSSINLNLIFNNFYYLKICH